jgi:hypothetical protein
MKSEITWHMASEPPPVKPGGMEYFLAVTKQSVNCFGAYYLNNYFLNYDECPDGTLENNYEQCSHCESGDGHLCTGWYEETENNDGGVFSPIDVNGNFVVIAWAEPPANPFMKKNEDGNP